MVGDRDKCFWRRLRDHGRVCLADSFVPTLARSAAALGRERFLSEIKTTAKLQQPHILPLLDSGDTDGLLYYVMPLATGETLRARLVRERQLPIEDAIRIAVEVADALAAAHGLGIIHRDIKPERPWPPLAGERLRPLDPDELRC